MSDTLKAELDQLAEWRNLRPSPDTTKVTSVEEFAQRRMLYSLTQMGEAVEASLGTYAGVLARRAELQTVALEDIRTGLTALILLAEAEMVDAARAAASLRDLDTVFSSLADNAVAFMSSLTRSIDTAAEGEEGFITYKEGLIGYLQRFISDLVVASGQIAEQLGTLERLGIDRVLTAAAGRWSTDATPGDVEEHDATADPDTIADRADHIAEHRHRLEQEWEGLRRWFVGSADGPSQAQLLRARARSAIPDLLETVQTLHERRSGRSDRMADYLTLARWFAQAPDDAARHRLWRAAFGFTPRAISASTAKHWMLAPNTRSRQPLHGPTRQRYTSVRGLVAPPATANRGLHASSTAPRSARRWPVSFPRSGPSLPPPASSWPRGR